MTRAYRTVDARQPEEVFVALRAALADGGPAVVPRSAEHGSQWPPIGARASQNVALVIETSGSTGVPKRVALSADALLASAAASAGAMGGQGQWLLALPAHYVAGAQVLVRSLAAGTEPVYYGEGHFDPLRFAELTARLDAEQLYTSLVPVQLARIVEAAEGGLRQAGDALRRFDGILVGGQSLDPGVRTRAEALGTRLLTTYGSSETAGGCVYDGVPIGTTVVRAVDQLLEISGPTLAEGYIDDDERTAAAFHEDGGVRWYRTGDLGDVVDGRVTVRGRSDNVLISGGEKVLLDAVEYIVRSVPALGEAVVVAADDDEWGQVPVVVATGSDDLAGLRERVSRELGRAAAPARIVTVAELPRLSSGKPDRLSAARLARAAGHAESEA
ncbi:AMP-binding protein [uncultured Leifsonia sp.]|uniref:AMP-binding protein n=1 Tax=uncultured Leifsonia sp. TaxID=340359 RepID=UPI0025E66EB4|nr:AMP-binding protein [uncultured Leifsonia sp.]